MKMFTLNETKIASLVLLQTCCVILNTTFNTSVSQVACLGKRAFVSASAGELVRLSHSRIKQVTHKIQTIYYSKKTYVKLLALCLAQLFNKYYLHPLSSPEKVKHLLCSVKGK